MPFSNNPSRSNNASGSNNASRFGKFVVPVLLAGMTQAACTPNSTGNTATFSEQELRDKIKGAWAAQTIGVTYGFPVEFRFNSVMVPDDYELAWYDGYLFETFDERPGVYDDI